MKDELIDTINAKIRQDRYWMTVSAFILARHQCAGDAFDYAPQTPGICEHDGCRFD